MEPSHAPPSVPQEEEEMKRLGEFTLFPTDDPFVRTPSLAPIDVEPAQPTAQNLPEEDYFLEPRAESGDAEEDMTPLPDSPRKRIPENWKQAHSRTSSQYSDLDNITPIPPLFSPKPTLPRQSSAASSASNTTFSTPGRDEMERKRAHVKAGDEGVFGGVKGMKELAAKRRQISDGTGKSVSQRFEEVGGKKKGEDGKKKETGERGHGGLCKCEVM